MADRWKQIERDLSKLLPGGKRLPSAGVPQPDVESDDFTFEVKSRARLNFPAWVLEAFDQRAINQVIRPKKWAFNLFAVHFGKGHPQRWFLATEVEPRNASELADAIRALTAATSEIEGVSLEEAA